MQLICLRQVMCDETESNSKNSICDSLSQFNDGAIQQREDITQLQGINQKNYEIRVRKAAAIKVTKNESG